MAATQPSFPAGSFATPSIGGQVYSQLFTANGLWTAPTGVTRVRAWCVGGGAGTAYYNGACTQTAYGGAGGVSVGAYTVIPGTNYAITIGAGGAGVAGTTNITGGSGGTTSFGGLISATGGSGGNYNGAGTVTNGSTGSGINGTIYNSSAVSGGAFVPYLPLAIAPVNMGFSALAFAQTSAAQVASGQYGAGNGGGGNGGGSKGGVGGMIYLEWVQ